MMCGHEWHDDLGIPHTCVLVPHPGDLHIDPTPWATTDRHRCPSCGAMTSMQARGTLCPRGCGYTRDTLAA